MGVRQNGRNIAGALRGGDRFISTCIRFSVISPFERSILKALCLSKIPPRVFDGKPEFTVLC